MTLGRSVATLAAAALAAAAAVALRVLRFLFSDLFAARATCQKASKKQKSMKQAGGRDDGRSNVETQRSHGRTPAPVPSHHEDARHGELRGVASRRYVARPI